MVRHTIIAFLMGSSILLVPRAHAEPMLESLLHLKPSAALRVETTSRLRIEGRFLRATGDTLFLSSQRSETNPEVVIPAASIARLYVADGTRGHFWRGAGLGLLGGALIGGVAGSTTRFCLDECTDDEAKKGAIVVGVILGAPAGFLLGGIIGGLIRSDRWRLVSTSDHRIGVAPRLDPLGLVVDVRF